MMVKKTWRKRLTAFIMTAKRYSHASPDILTTRGGKSSSDQENRLFEIGVDKPDVLGAICDWRAMTCDMGTEFVGEGGRK